MKMNKILSGTFLKIFAVLAITGSAMFFASGANAGPRGGFEGPGPDLVTVQQIGQMKDDANVSLRGNIIKALGGDKYLFKDDTGTIVVEIDKDEWDGQIVKPGDTVTIIGEVDKGITETTIDAEKIIKE